MFGSRVLPSPAPDVTARAPATEEELGGFLRRIADAERRALADLYVCFGRETLAVVGRDLADPVQAGQILRATFIEVWLTAGRRSSAIRARDWMLSIAHRRAAERLDIGDEVHRNPLLVSIRDTVDRQITNEFDHLVSTPASPQLLGAVDDRLGQVGQPPVVAARAVSQ